MAISESQKKASMKYAKEKLKRIPLDVPKEKYTEIQAMAQATGQSVNGYIKRAIKETMERDRALINNESIGKLKIEPTEPKKEPNKQYKQLIDSDLAEIDLERLIHDALYQIEIGEIYGMETLAKLLEKARQQSTTETPLT